MIELEVIWWLLFFGIFGLCAGSFLNAMIYRIPRNISLSKPLRSFCPSCEACIRWQDNLPLISYLRLRGRCRDCGVAISPRYPTIEMLGALLVLLVFDAFFIAHTHVGLGSNLPGVTWQLSEDWPIFLAHVILFCALLAMSAIDIEHYWVDIRFSSLAVGAGFVLHALWTPAQGERWHRPAEATAAASLAATCVLLVTVLVLWRIRPSGHDAPEQSEDGDAPPETEGLSAPQEKHVLGYFAAAAAALGLLILVCGAFAEAADLGCRLETPLRWAPGVVLLLVLIVVCGAQRRESDTAIIETIESERSTARQTAARELLVLLPAIAVGALTFYFTRRYVESGARLAAALSWAPLRGWRPMEGLGTAAAGFVIGGGIGWIVRLVATFVMGKEAFGIGDIHMMAAAGCVAGWPVVLIGFVLSSVLALLGWGLGLPFKRCRAIPLGPWLSISFLIVVLLYDRIIGSRLIQNVIEVFTSPLVIYGNITPPP